MNTYPMKQVVKKKINLDSCGFDEIIKMKRKNGEEFVTVCDSIEKTILPEKGEANCVQINYGKCVKIKCYTTWHYFALHKYFKTETNNLNGISFFFFF